MSNLQSLLGGAAWTAVATVLLLAAFEPVAKDEGSAGLASIEAATARG